MLGAVSGYAASLATGHSTFSGQSPAASAPAPVDDAIARASAGEPLSPPNDPAYSLLIGDVPLEWPAYTLSALEAWNCYPGTYFSAATRPQEAPIIAVLDSGIDAAHPDFLNPGAAGPDVSQGGQLLLSAARSFVSGAPDPFDVTDELGRGTHLAGIIAAAANNGETAGSGIAGLAYPARLLPIRITNAAGTATWSDVADAITYAADQGATVILIGPSGPTWSARLQAAIDYAWDRGCFLVAPAGDGALAFAAACPHVFGVGAVTAAGEIAHYSPAGDGVALVAPGGDETLGIYSTLPTYACPFRPDLTGPPYGFHYGTVYAAAHVAGAAALYAGAIGLRPDTGGEGAMIWQALQGSVGCGDWAASRGYGLVSPAPLLSGAVPPTGSGSIVGRVLCDDAPRPDTEVVAVPRSGGGPSTAISTWPAGAYRLANLTPGLYTVTVTREGKSGVWQDVRVSPGCDRPAVDFLLGDQALSAELRASALPTAAVRGKLLQFSVTFGNTGPTAWTRAESIFLTLDSDEPTWEGIQVGLRPEEIVTPGGEKSYGLSVQAPDRGGFYHVSVRMCQQGGAGGFGPAAEATISVTSFLDVPADYWALDAIEAVKAASIVGGYGGDVYRPNVTVTRDQMAVFISRALAGGDANVPDGPATPSFPDVPASHWAYKYIEYARQQGIVSGYWDGYHPGDNLDRGQMAVFIARAMAGGEAGLASYTPPESASFADVPPDFWSYKHVEYLRQVGVTGGYPDGQYHPERECARDQMAVYVARAFALPM